LFVSFEEAESDNDTDKAVNCYVKRWSNNHISVNAMHMNMSVDKNYAIGMMVSNDPQ
jgi:hypothetical protein